MDELTKRRQKRDSNIKPSIVISRAINVLYPPIKEPERKVRKRPRKRPGLNKKDYKELANSVRKRDGYMCQECGAPGWDVHHIKLRSVGGEDALINLTTLCALCHHDKHPSVPLKGFLYRKPFVL